MMPIYLNPKGKDDLEKILRVSYREEDIRLALAVCSLKHILEFYLRGDETRNGLEQLTVILQKGIENEKQLVLVQILDHIKIIIDRWYCECSARNDGEPMMSRSDDDDS